MTRTLILTTCLVALVVGCGDNSDDGGDDDTPAIDANPNAPDADPNAPDAAPDNPDASVGILCGTEECDPATQECCVEQGGGGAQTCVATGSCNGAAFQCDGIEDCPTVGDVCCFGAGNPQDPVSQCIAAVDCETPTCDTAADCADPTSDLCCQVGTLQVCVDAPQCPGP